MRGGCADLEGRLKNSKRKRGKILGYRGTPKDRSLKLRVEGEHQNITV